MELTTRAGKPVASLGLAGRPELERGCVDAAFAVGLDYFFYSDDCDAMMDGLAVLCRYHCDEVFIATGSESLRSAETTRLSRRKSAQIGR